MIANLAAAHSSDTHSAFAARLPALHAKLRDLAIAADARHGWRRVRPDALHAHTIELLDYSAAAHASLGWHVDGQSAVTLLALLSHPSEFEGGRLQHVVAGSVVDAAPAKGDASVP